MAAKLGGGDVPQANRPERVMALAVARAEGKALTPDSLGLQPRDLRYYVQAAVILGLLTEADEPSTAAHELAALSADARLSRLAELFAASALARAWCAFANVAHPTALDPSSAEAFLLARSELAPSTARRRAATLRHWWIALTPHLPELPPPSRAQLDLDLTKMDDIPEEARELFARGAAHLSGPEVAALRQDVRGHLEEFRAAARRSELLPLDIAEELASKLDALLADYASLSPEHGALVVGAARYFVSHEDARHDLSSVLGLDDDAAVFNYAARQIGRPEMVIDL